MIKLMGTDFEIKSFPDNTPLIKRMIGCWNPDTFLYWYFDSMEELFSVICIAQNIREYQRTNLHLVLPYIPNARMDRTEDSKDVFTLKYFCKVINSLEFKSVTVFDPHSAVSAALLDRVFVQNPDRLINRVFKEINSTEAEEPFFVFPDAGAAKRYSGHGQSVTGFKRRDWDTGEILGLDLIGEIPQGRPALIVDDICSRGGTFIHTAQKLHEAGVEKVYLFVSHCENTVLQGDLLNGEHIEHLFTTDSILRADHEMITKFKIWEVM